MVEYKVNKQTYTLGRYILNKFFKNHDKNTYISICQITKIKSLLVKGFNSATTKKNNLMKLFLEQSNAKIILFQLLKILNLKRTLTMLRFFFCLPRSFRKSKHSKSSSYLRHMNIFFVVQKKVFLVRVTLAWLQGQAHPLTAKN